MKLRVERLADDPAKSKLCEDINEMAAMLNATLDYLRGEAQTQPWQLLDIQALVDSMAEDAQETGQEVTVSGNARCRCWLSQRRCGVACSTWWKMPCVMDRKRTCH